jgi:L-aminopeptidase/D-esterase-like protein
MTTTRILLTTEQAEQLRHLQGDAPVFFACGRASHPDHHHLALHIIEADSIDIVNAAARVAMGQAVARKAPGKASKD